MRILPAIAVLAGLGVLAATWPTVSWPIVPRAAAAEPANQSPEFERELQGLLEDLAGETRQRRSAAEKRLLELGPKVLAHLPAPELLPSNSVREAVRRIRLELGRRQARESVLSSRVTLDRELPLSAALAEITRQTGNVVDGRGLPADVLARPIALETDELPFWQVVDRISDQLKVRFEYDAALRGLKLLPVAGERGFQEPVATSSGAFRIEVSSASRLQRTVRRGAGNFIAAPGDLLRLTLRVRPEPRLRPLFLQFATRDVAVRAIDKHDLSPLSPDASYDLSLAEGANQSPIQLDYVVPPGADVSAVALNGKMRCTTAAGIEAFRFTGIAAARDLERGGIVRRRGGVTVGLNRVVQNQNELRVRIAVAYETGGPAFESHRTWFLHNDVYLEDPAGRRVRLNGGSETVQQGDGGVGIEYRFIDLPEPLSELTFVYLAPTLIVDVPLEFAIESVPVGRRQPAAR